MAHWPRIAEELDKDNRRSKFEKNCLPDNSCHTSDTKCHIGFWRHRSPCHCPLPGSTVEYEIWLCARHVGLARTCLMPQLLPLPQAIIGIVRRPLGDALQGYINSSSPVSWSFFHPLSYLWFQRRRPRKHPSPWRRLSDAPSPNGGPHGRWQGPPSGMSFLVEILRLPFYPLNPVLPH